MKDRERNVMRNVKINKNELLTIVRNNLDQHRQQYLESIADYKVAVENIAKENAKLAKKWEPESGIQFKSFPHAPNSYESAYNKSIRMLELSVEDIIDLDSDVFNQLVLDDWSWKGQFMAASATYKSFV